MVIPQISPTGFPWGGAPPWVSSDQLGKATVTLTLEVKAVANSEMTTSDRLLFTDWLLSHRNLRIPSPSPRPRKAFPAKMALVMVDDGCKVEQKNISLVVFEENSISSSQFFTLGCCILNLGGGFTHF